MKTQKQILLKYLKGGNRITALKASKKFGIARLASRIYDLKNMGYNIKSRPKKVVKSNGDKAIVSEYFLKKNS